MTRIGLLWRRRWPWFLLLVGLSGLACMTFLLTAQAAGDRTDIAALQGQLNTAIAEKDATADALEQANADRVADGEEPITPAPVSVPVQGSAGPAGVGITTLTRDPGTCVLSATLTDGTVVDLGDVCGPAGADGERGSAGADGVGVADVQVDDCDLVVTYTDGTTHNAGNVCAAASVPDRTGSEPSPEESS